MKRLIALLLLMACPAVAEAEILFRYTPSATIYARVRTAANTTFAVALTEENTGGLGIYKVTDAAILAAAPAATLAANVTSGYQFTIFVGTPSTTANDEVIGGGTFGWSGTAEAPLNESGLLFTGTIETVIGVTNTDFTVTPAIPGYSAYNGAMVVIYDVSNSNFPTVRYVANQGAGNEIVIGTAADFTVVAGDIIKIYAVPRQLPAALPGTANGLFIAGSNAATTVNITGSLSQLTTLVDGADTFDEAVAANTTLTGAKTNTDTLLTRVTSTRAGYLDNLSAGAVAQQASLSTALTNIGLVKTQTDKMDTSLVADGSGGFQWSVTAVENAPSATATIDWDQLIADNDDVVGSFGERISRIPNAAPGIASGLATAQNVDDIEVTVENLTIDGGEFIAASDINIEAVPSNRTFMLVHTTAGLRDKASKTITLDSEPVTYAVDFRNDSAANQKIYSVAAPTIVSGTAGGVTFGTVGREGTQAKFRITGVTAGEYRVRVEVKYGTSAGPTQRGDILIKVVE